MEVISILPEIIEDQTVLIKIEPEYSKELDNTHSDIKEESNLNQSSVETKKSEEKSLKMKTVGDKIDGKHNLQYSEMQVISILPETIEDQTILIKIEPESSKELDITHLDIKEESNLTQSSVETKKSEEKTLKMKTVGDKIDRKHNLQYCQMQVISILPDVIDDKKIFIKIEPESSKELDNTHLDIKEESNLTQSSVETKKSEEKTLEMKVKRVKRIKTEPTLDDSSTSKLEVAVLAREEMENEREYLRNEDKYVKRPFRCEKCIVGFDHEINLKHHLEKKHNHTVVDKIDGSYNLHHNEMKAISILPEIIEDQTVLIKIEPESSKELDNTHLDIEEESNLTLSSVETKKSEEKMLTTKVKKFKKMNKEPTLDDSSTSKPEVIVLTSEEMEKEREYLRKDSKYLKRPFRCEKCIVGFDHEIILKLHLEKKHSHAVGGYTCNVCECVYTSDMALKTHSKRHFTRFKCNPCNKQYLDERAAVVHYREKHSQVSHSYKCKFEKCDFETRSHRSYTYHVSRHNLEPCQHCGKLYMRGAKLRMHINTVHNKARLFKCELCDKQYKQRFGLSVHMQSAHESNSAAYCEQCRMHFRTKQILARHMRYHSTHVEKKYTCDDCGTRFVSKCNLKYHIEWAHLKISKYRCQHCSKVLGTGRSLRRHIAFVHEKKRLPKDKICGYCGKAFTTSWYLQTHIRTHTGETPHKSTDCAATFAHPAALYNHKKLLHETDNIQNDVKNV